MHQGIESIRKGKLQMAKEIKRGSERELGTQGEEPKERQRRSKGVAE